MCLLLRIGFIAATLAVCCWAQSPSLDDYHQAVAEAIELQHQGNLDAVVEKLTPWVERFPQRAEGRHFIGITFYEQQNYPAAIEHLAVAVELEEPGSVAWRQTVEHLGLAYYFSHRTKEAAPLLEKTLGWKAEDTYLRYALAMCHIYSHEPDKARGAFATLYNVPADSAQAALLASHFMNRENFASEAETLVRQAQEIDPSLPDLHYRLGVIDLTNGNHAGAAEHFRQELAQNPLHPMAWHYLGAAYAQTGELEDAIVSLERAIWLNLRNVPSYLLIANVYNRRNQYPLAENALRQALSLDPRNYEARFLLARVYQKTNRPELAKQEMARARKLRQTGQ